jgi:hypothetical protein
MSNADTRQAIAAALSRVTGIHGHPARPTALSEGDAWPQWRGSEKAGGHAFTNTWAVLVVLPADDVSADAFVDAHGEQLVNALRPVLYVSALTPAEIPSEAGPMYALLITGRSE